MEGKIVETALKKISGKDSLASNFKALKNTADMYDFIKENISDIIFSYEDFLNYIFEKYPSLNKKTEFLSDEKLKNIAGGISMQDFGKNLAIFALTGSALLGSANITSFAANSSEYNNQTLVAPTSYSEQISKKDSKQSEAPKVISCTHDKIVIEISPGYECNIMRHEIKGEIPWQRPFQDSGSFEGLESLTSYTINVRDKETHREVVKPFTVKTIVNPKDLKIMSCTFDQIAVQRVKNCEYSIARLGKDGKATQERPFQSSGIFDNLDGNTEYRISVRDKGTQQEVIKPFIQKTTPNPHDTKILSVSDNQIIIDPIPGYQYSLIDRDKSSEVRGYQYADAGVFNNLKSNKTYRIGVSYAKQSNSKSEFYEMVGARQNIFDVKTKSVLNNIKEENKADPQNPKVISVTQDEIKMEDLPSDYIYKLQSIDFKDVVQNSGTFKNLKSSKEYWLTVLTKDKIWGNQLVCCEPILIKTKDDAKSESNSKNEEKKEIPQLMFTTHNKIAVETKSGYDYKIFNGGYESDWQNSGVFKNFKEGGWLYYVYVRDTKTGLIVSTLQAKTKFDQGTPQLLGCTHNKIVVRTLPGYEYQLIYGNNRYASPIKTQDNGTFENLDSNTPYLINIYKKSDSKRDVRWPSGGSIGAKTKDELTVSMEKNR